MPDHEVKPIAEQIVEDFFNRLEKSESYDKATLARLKEVASSGKLTSYKAIISAINAPEG